MVLTITINLAANVLDASAQRVQPPPQGGEMSEHPARPQSAAEPKPSQTSMMAMLQQKLDQNPTHSDTWRLIGKLYTKTGDFPAADHHFQQALAYDPQNVAAHADYAKFLLQLENQPAATHHIQAVFALGAESEYADEFRQLGWQELPDVTEAITKQTNAAILASVNNDSSTKSAVYRMNRQEEPGLYQQASLEVQTFDGADDLTREINRREADALAPQSRWRGFWELAALYNSNVSLTPISRELSNSDASGFQLSFSPDVEYSLLVSADRRSGPIMRGLFNFNESAHSDLNLASYQPGWFGELDWGWNEWELVSRTEYIYAVDFFGGDRIGNRNSLMFSTTGISPELDIYYGYLLLSQSEFDDDGTTPSTTSLDGPAITIGISRFVTVNWRSLSMLTAGLDIEHAETEGSDYRYTGGTLHGSATWTWSEKWETAMNAGVGLRSYADFTGTPSRDETVVRGTLKHRYRWNTRWSTVAHLGFDRFVSENDSYDAERYEAGLATVWMY